MIALTAAAVDNGAAMPRKRDFIEKLLLVDTKEADVDVVIVALVVVPDDDKLLVCIRTFIVSNGSMQSNQEYETYYYERKENIS